MGVTGNATLLGWAMVKHVLIEQKINQNGPSSSEKMGSQAQEPVSHD
jgi:hypothetical protein